MYRILKSLYCIPEIHITLYGNYSCIKNGLKKNEGAEAGMHLVYNGKSESPWVCTVIK